MQGRGQTRGTHRSRFEAASTVLTPQGQAGDKVSRDAVVREESTSASGKFCR